MSEDGSYCDCADKERAKTALEQSEAQLAECQQQYHQLAEANCEMARTVDGLREQLVASQQQVGELRRVLEMTTKLFDLGVHYAGPGYGTESGGEAWDKARCILTRVNAALALTPAAASERLEAERRAKLEAFVATVQRELETRGDYLDAYLWLRDALAALEGEQSKCQP